MKTTNSYHSTGSGKNFPIIYQRNLILSNDKAIKKSTLFPNRNGIENEPEMDYTKSTLPPYLEIFKQKLLSRIGFVE